MRPETYQRLADRQETYWWHRVRRTMALALLQRHGLSPGARWLDVGCGPGGNFSMLDSLKPSLVTGIDMSPIALDLARKHAPTANLVRADINEPLPFAEGSFDVVTIFNVLYHGWVREEASILAEAARVLRPSGLLLITEPAFNALMREMDDAVMTRRRYRVADFDPWFSAAGLETLFSSYFTSFGYPILLASKVLKRANRNVPGQQTALDLRPIPGFLNAALAAVATVEARALASGLRLPFGTTLVRVARRLPAAETANP